MKQSGSDGEDFSSDDIVMMDVRSGGAAKVVAVTMVAVRSVRMKSKKVRSVRMKRSKYKYINKKNI